MSYNSPPQQQYNQQPQQQYYPPPPSGAPPQGQQQQTFAPPPSGAPQSYPPPPAGGPPADQQQQHQQKQQQQQQQYNQQQYNQQPYQNAPQQSYHNAPQQSYQSDIKQSAPPETSDTGNAQGVNYTIKHRNTNSTLELNLPPGASVKTKAGAMIHMQPTVQLKGQVKVSFKKLISGGSMTESIFTGPGKVTLAPTLLGDIVPLPVDNGHQWTVGKDAFLASTEGIVRETTTQGFGKAMFSGESLFIYRVTGQGTMWLQSYGAIEPIHLGQGEQHIVDNGHLVAWNCNYQMERAGGGGSSGGGGGGFGGMLKGGLDALKTGEGLVCRFTGPGIVYIQTRNLEEFSRWVASQVPGRAV